MHRAILSIITLSIFLCISFGFGSETEAPSHVHGLVKEGKYLEAIAECQAIVEHAQQDDTKATAFLMIGDIYSYYLDDYDAALRYYDLVKTEYPKSNASANAFFNSGMILYEKGRFKEALLQFNVYLKNYPQGTRRDTASYMVEACSREIPLTVAKEDKPVGPAARDIDIVRVLLAASAKPVVITVTSSVEVMDANEKRTLGRLATGDKVVGVSNGMLMIDGQPVGDGEIILICAPGEKLKLDGKRYRGKVKLKKTALGGVAAVNVLRTEEYLYGVVPREMLPSWPLEALKTQAVAARTFVLYQKDKNRNDDYDVTATTLSQVYGGFDCETSETRQAVDCTKGEVITHGGRLILAYYHANSGGMTEDAGNVWTTDLPYLKGVIDPFSEGAPDCRWSVLLRLKDIARSLSENGIRVNVVHDVTPVGVSPSGRVTRVRVVHDRGETILRSNDFRIKLDARLVKSTLFVAVREGDVIRFDGRGYGHGVGLSQWGAREMALQGYTYRDILKHYYTGVEVGNTSPLAQRR